MRSFATRSSVMGLLSLILVAEPRAFAQTGANPATSASERILLTAGIGTGLTSIHASNFGNQYAARDFGAPFHSSTTTLRSTALTLRFEYEYVRNVLVGLTIGGGTIHNSSGTTSSSTHIIFGPSLTLMVGDLYFGVDIPLHRFAFDNVPTQLTSDAPYSTDGWALQAKDLLLVGFAARVGVAFPVKQGLDVVAELSGQALPILLSQQEVVASRRDPSVGFSWETSTAADPQNASAYGCALAVALRLRL